MIPFKSGLLMLLLTVGWIATAVADEPFGDDAAMVIFLGDSNTYAGHYIALVEAQLRVHADSKVPTILNLGLSSETASGLSEPIHPFPRPCVHERLARTLEKVDPDVVFVGYGVNDAIYAPPSEENFAAYKDGMQRLISQIQQSQARCIVLTPPSFDPQPMRIKGKLEPAGSAADAYSWKAIFQDYDTVMRQYTDWLQEQADDDLLVIDWHGAISQYMAEKHASDPKYSLSPDGIHLDHEGHAVLAAAILKAIGVPNDTPPPAELVAAIAKRQSIMRDAWLSEIGHQRPGIKPGLPIAEAKRKAAEIDGQLRILK